jgi:hypothetical protein
MLAHEWRELERLCERLSDLRERLAAAEKTGNTGLVEGLNLEMDQVARLRDRLVRYISARLGSATADPLRACGPALRWEKRRNDCDAALMPARE